MVTFRCADCSAWLCRRYQFCLAPYLVCLQTRQSTGIVITAVSFSSCDCSPRPTAPPPPPPVPQVVYIAPMKALVRERMTDWRGRLQNSLGLRLVELTGDVTPDVRAIQSADVIVTTPEKWDGISRSWQTRNYVQDVALIIIDEIHMLGTGWGNVAGLRAGVGAICGSGFCWGDYALVDLRCCVDSML